MKCVSWAATTKRKQHHHKHNVVLKKVMIASAKYFFAKRKMRRNKRWQKREYLKVVLPFLKELNLVGGNTNGPPKGLSSFKITEKVSFYGKAILVTFGY